MEFEELFPDADGSEKRLMLMMMLYGGSMMHEVEGQRYRYKDGLFHEDPTPGASHGSLKNPLPILDPTGGIAFIAAEAADIERHLLQCLKRDNRVCFIRHNGMKFMFKPKNGGHISRVTSFNCVYRFLCFWQ
jgi:hypothetical protein